MAMITYIEPDGTSVTIDVEPGSSVMRGAVDNGVDGIRAECGGAAACATCQVEITGDWATRIPAPGLAESSMLDEEDLSAGRRLSCQITVEPALDGLVVQVVGA